MAPVYIAFLRFMGDDNEAKNYSYSLEVGGNGRKMIWQGVPRSIRDSHRKVRDSFDGLIIQRNMALFFSGGDRKELKLRVTGRIWKEQWSLSCYCFFFPLSCFCSSSTSKGLGLVGCWRLGCLGGRLLGHVLLLSRRQCLFALLWDNEIHEWEDCIYISLYSKAMIDYLSCSIYIKWRSYSWWIMATLVGMADGNGNVTLRNSDGYVLSPIIIPSQGPESIGGNSGAAAWCNCVSLVASHHWKGHEVTSNSFSKPT